MLKVPGNFEIAGIYHGSALTSLTLQGSTILHTEVPSLTSLTSLEFFANQDWPVSVPWESFTRQNIQLQELTFRGSVTKLGSCQLLLDYLISYSGLRVLVFDLYQTTKDLAEGNYFATSLFKDILPKHSAHLTILQITPASPAWCIDDSNIHVLSQCRNLSSLEGFFPPGQLFPGQENDIIVS
jgi:hypothetical protein